MASRQPVFDFAGLVKSIQEADARLAAQTALSISVVLPRLPADRADTARTISPPASGAPAVQESADSVRTICPITRQAVRQPLIQRFRVRGAAVTQRTAPTAVTPREQMAEGRKLDATIAADLKVLGYGG